MKAAAAITAATAPAAQTIGRGRGRTSRPTGVVVARRRRSESFTAGGGIIGGRERARVASASADSRSVASQTSQPAARWRSKSMRSWPSSAPTAYVAASVSYGS